jgi:hypothetical protein
MRIIASFQDYYDSAMKYGQDTSIIFERTTQEIQCKEIYRKLFNQDRPYNWRVTEYNPVDEFHTDVTSFESCVIGFCGKFYKCIRWWSDNSRFRHFYTRDSFVKFVTTEMKMPYGRTQKEIEKGIKGVRGISKGYFNDSIQKYSKLYAWMNSLFQEYNVPYYCLTIIPHTSSEVQLTLIPNLKSMEFGKIVNPVQAYQEIAMYVGGVLRQPVHPTVEISNEEMAVKKGFGHKYAFRKEPSKHK